MTGTIDISQAERVSITDDIVEKLIAYIADNQIKPGELLPSEKQLGEALGVSRLPLREALSRLKALGLVNSRQGKGVFVCNVDASNLFRQISPVMRSQGTLSLRHMIEVRQCLEPAVAGLAAQRRDDAALGIMAECLEKMRLHLDKPMEYEQFDLEFHLALVRAAQNPALEILVSTIHDLMLATQREAGRSIAITHVSLGYHQKIYDAVQNCDPQAAATAMQEHLRNVAVRITAVEEETDG
jgi:GntR family transcriptional regulator, transcriptional repressor for pyruvate dehydrogenase complex